MVSCRVADVYDVVCDVSNVNRSETGRLTIKLARTM